MLPYVRARMCKHAPRHERYPNSGAGPLDDIAEIRKYAESLVDELDRVRSGGRGIS